MSRDNTLEAVFPYLGIGARPESVIRESSVTSLYDVFACLDNAYATNEILSVLGN